MNQSTNSWCSRCQKYTENNVGSSIMRILGDKKIKITNYSCDECHSFKESVVEEIPIIIEINKEKE